MFEKASHQSITGYFRGKSEVSIAIEIVNGGHRDVLALAQEIKSLNGQNLRRWRSSMARQKIG